MGSTYDTGQRGYGGARACAPAGRNAEPLARALGLLHLLRSQARFATEEEFTLAAVIDAIVELEAADIVPVPWEGDEIDQSGLELLAAALQLVEDAGDVSLADASVFLREACRLQGQL